VNSYAKLEPRYQLFRLLGEPQRLKLLGLTALDELSVGELAELLQESQPNISRHVHLLRQAGLLHDRHQGTRVYVRLSEKARDDAVVLDAITEGQRLCEDCVTRDQISKIIAARELGSRAYFAEQAPAEYEIETTAHVPVYAMALSMMATERGVSLDAGTGDGSLLDLLAPTYDRVIAVDRSAVQIERAKERVTRRGFTGVDLECEVEVEWSAAPVLGVELDLPDLTQGVGLHEVPLVVHVESVIDRMVLEVGHVSGHIDDCH